MNELKTDADFCQWILQYFKKGIVRIEFDPKKPDIDFDRYGKVVHGYLLDVDPTDTHLFGEVREWDFEKNEHRLVPNKLKALKLTMKGIPNGFRIEDEKREAQVEAEISTIGFYPHEMAEIRYLQPHELEGRPFDPEKDIYIDPNFDENGNVDSDYFGDLMD